MKGHFPVIRFVRENSIYEQLMHVQSEAIEVKYALYQHRVDEEMADLLHSCETYFRIREREGLDVEATFAKVVEKNSRRGYYV